MNQPPETRESLLLRLADAHDQEAWQQFAAIYRPLVYRFARHRGLQDADAQDLSQRVLMSVAVSIERWESKASGARFRTWLHTVSRNAVIDYFRLAKPDAAEGGTTAVRRLQGEIDRSAAEQEIDSEYQRQLFRWAARSIRDEFEEETWRAFWLSAVDGKTVAAVAEQLSKSLGAVYVARSRVMQRLRTKVSECGADFDDDRCPTEGVEDAN